MALDVRHQWIAKKVHVSLLLAILSNQIVIMII
jgi:hypothetical protein